MKTRMVGLAVLSFVTITGAGEPVTTEPAPPTASEGAAVAPKTPAVSELESAARRVGVTAEELKRLRQLGFTDAEVLTQTQTGQRTARQIITECEVIADAARAVGELNARVAKLPARDQAGERDRGLRSALARIRRERRTTRDELRRILAGTSLLNEEELRRALGPGFFRTDDLLRVFFNADDDRRATK